MWTRISGSEDSIDPNVSTSGASYDVSTWQLEVGTDLLLSEQEAGMLVGGLSLRYGTVNSQVGSIYGSGQISATGYGLGASLTWYADNGFYVDGQTQLTWFDSDITSATAGLSLVEGNDAFGFGAGVEAGQRIELGDGWSLTPQAQLSYSAVEFDVFTDAFGANVSLDESGSLVGRVGISLDREVEWLDDEGRANRSHVYGVANIYQNIDSGSQVEVEDTDFSSENDALWGGVGIGGSFNFADDKFSLYGELQAKTSLENFGESSSINGTVGLRVRW